MSQKLFEVEDHFKIPGRGIVIACEWQIDASAIKDGNFVVLVRPDGTEITVEVGGTDTVQTVGGIRRFAILIKHVSKDDVPIGTCVFLEK